MLVLGILLRMKGLSLFVLNKVRNFLDIINFVFDDVLVEIFNVFCKVLNCCFIKYFKLFLFFVFLSNFERVVYSDCCIFEIIFCRWDGVLIGLDNFKRKVSYIEI